jgi:hypothetical protein
MKRRGRPRLYRSPVVIRNICPDILDLCSEFFKGLIPASSLEFEYTLNIASIYLVYERIDEVYLKYIQTMEQHQFE